MKKEDTILFKNSRYSYVTNNPLKYTDPSGYVKTPRWKQWVRFIFGIQPYISSRYGTRMYTNEPDDDGGSGGGGGGGSSYYDFASSPFERENNHSSGSEYSPDVSRNRSVGNGAPGRGSGSGVPDDPPKAANSGVTPWDVGVEWLTGKGPRHRDFTNGDVFTEMLRQHDHVLATKASISGMIANGIMTGNAPYNLSGIQGVGKYLKDYSTLATGGLTGNLAVTYLGSYNLQWEVTAINGNSATVQFLVNNTSSIQSATRPPVIGYTSWWQNSLDSWINNSFSSGPMSPTTQTFRWTETVSW